MNVLFIGGTGLISGACSKLALDKGLDLYHLNRGKTNTLRPIEGVNLIQADIRNLKEAKLALKQMNFDVVVDWISFLPEHLEQNLELFKDRCKQYVFISSASAYETPAKTLPVTEETPLDNPIWQYSRDKIDCEKILIAKAPSMGFDYTIVRPSHTYDKYATPPFGDYTTLKRMMDGKAVAIPGDGTSLWTLTHNSDFAKGLVGLLGNSKALNEAFHITSSEWITWEEIYRCFAAAFGVKAKLVAVPSSVLATFNKDMGDSLLGDKCHSMIFDNAKIKSVVSEFNCTVPFAEGVKETAAWYQHGDHGQKVDPKLDAFFDEVTSAYSELPW